MQLSYVTGLLLWPTLAFSAGTIAVPASPTTRLAAACAAEVGQRLPALSGEAAGMADHLAAFPPAAEPLIVDSLALLATGLAVVPAGAGGLPGRSTVYRTAAPAGIAPPGVETLATSYVSPLVLDLVGAAVPDVPGGVAEPHPFAFSPARVAWFDSDGDGYSDLTEWPGPNLGLLVHAPGAVPPAAPSAADLIGTAGGYQDGFERLAAFDLNHDGQVVGSELAELLVWRDADGDAVAEAGEWLTPAGLGITALHLAHTGAAGTFQSGAVTRSMWDWWPTYAPARPAAPPPKATGATAFKAALTGVANLAGGPAATAFKTYSLGATWGVLSYDWLRDIGFILETSHLAAVAPRGDGIVLLDRPLEAPRQVRLWALSQDARAGGWRARRFDLPEDEIDTLTYDGTGTQILAASRSAARLYVVQAGALYGPIQWTAPVGLGFRAAWAPPFAVGRAFYLPGYFHDERGRPLADSLAVLKISNTKATLSSGADLPWLLGDRLPERGYAQPQIVQINSAKSAFAVSRDPATGAAVLLALGGSNAAKGTVRELDRAPAITALSANGLRVLYLVQPTDGTWEVRCVGAKEKTPTPVVWARPQRPASLELGYKGLSAFWQLVDWTTAGVTLETADPVKRLGPAPAPVAGPPGALRVASQEPIFVLQRPEGLILAVWRPTP